MDILYLTLSDPALHAEGIYSDLLNALMEGGHHLTIVYADGAAKKTYLTSDAGARLLKVRTGKQFGVGFIRKGFNMLRLEPRMKRAVRKYLGSERFDLVLYATPPVTFAGVVRYCRKKYRCQSYLMLKDIFPQNAVDIGLFKENGVIHRLFSKKESRLYEASDFIGCMSSRNRNYILSQQPYLPANRVEIFPNTVKVPPGSRVQVNLHTHLDKLKVPRDTVAFVFGGNFGKPQGVRFLMRAIEALQDYKKAFFLLAGGGSEAQYVRQKAGECENAVFVDYLPPEEYNTLIDECDVGIVSLDSRFTIPNYPSRILGYMAVAMPVLASTDRNTDIRDLVETEAECGLWNFSEDLEGFTENVRRLSEDAALRTRLGQNGRRYLEEHFDVSRSVKILESHFQGEDVSWTSQAAEMEEKQEDTAENDLVP